MALGFPNHRLIERRVALKEKNVRRHQNLARITSAIVSTYVSNNFLPQDELPSLISSTHKAVAGLGLETARSMDGQLPAVPIAKSVTAEFLICLEDGKFCRSMKRHLRIVHGLSPDEYRAKWGLPNDYPMVAPALSRHRSKIAKTIGLGQR